MNTAPKQPAPVGDPESLPGRASTPVPAHASPAGGRAVQARARVPQADHRTAAVLPAEPSHTAAPGEGRRWRIEFPPGQELLASNQSANWGRTHRIGQQLKGDAIQLCRHLKIPHLQRVAVVLEYQPPTKGRPVVRDVHNLAPTLKKVLDGTVTAGVLTDDSDRFVASVTYQPGDKYPGGRIVLHVIEVLT